MEKGVTRTGTSYRHGTSEGLSDPWVLARGLREGDPSSPVLKKEGWRWESGKFVHFCLYLANPLHCLFRRVLHSRQDLKKCWRVLVSKIIQNFLSAHIMTPLVILLMFPKRGKGKTFQTCKLNHISPHAYFRLGLEVTRRCWE